MSREFHKLTDKRFKAFADRGGASRLGDGGGLWLSKGRTGSCSWVFIYNRKVGGVAKRFEIGLGKYGVVTLAKAREEASRYRVMLSEGIDPLQAKHEIERERAAVRWTFKACADEYFAEWGRVWKNDSQRAEWQRGVKHCSLIWDVNISELGVAEVKKVVSDLSDRPSVARFVLSLIRRVIDWAAAHGHRDENMRNPASVSVIGFVMPVAKAGGANRRHHAAMPYAEVGAFVKGLRSDGGVPASALELIILTGVRKSEALGMRWDELDLANALWTIPASRMKAKVAHTVPLVPRAVEVLLGQMVEGEVSGRENSGLVFRTRHDNALSPVAFKYLGLNGFTTHGFRSSLRDYLGDCTLHEREIAEAILAHVVGGVEGAYRRGNALNKRRVALEDWSRYISA